MVLLTKQQKLVLAVVMLLLTTGWAVKAWRASHPAPEAKSSAVSP